MKTVKELTISVVYYARKVAQYPPESDGYDPVDLMNLQMAIKKLDFELSK